mgnify:CR=1 FL=1
MKADLGALRGRINDQAKTSRAVAEFVEFIENGARFKLYGTDMSRSGSYPSMPVGQALWLNVRLPHSRLETGVAPCVVTAVKGNLVEVIFRTHGLEGGPVVVASLFK